MQHKTVTLHLFLTICLPPKKRPSISFRVRHAPARPENWTKIRKPSDGFSGGGVTACSTTRSTMLSRSDTRLSSVCQRQTRFLRTHPFLLHSSAISALKSSSASSTFATMFVKQTIVLGSPYFSFSSFFLSSSLRLTNLPFEDDD